MNPKEQAERIVECFRDLGICLSHDGATEKSKREAEKACAIIALEMLIEANPTIEDELEIKVKHYKTFDKATTTIPYNVCNKAHYKEVLKAIKNME